MPSTWNGHWPPAAPAAGPSGSRRSTPESLPAADLSATAVIFCVNLPALAASRGREAAARMLRCRRATSSGSAARTSSRLAYNAMNALAQGSLLPAPLEDLRQPLARRGRELARRLPRQGQPGARPP